MATVVVTFFIKVRFYVCKMDADFKEKRSANISTLRREKRWSMNSQRLEEIVAELMRPIGDLRHSFDTDLSTLLEEYLTEAGLHALDAEDSDSGSGSETGDALVAPNFAELALLLQQSASIYGRKVDFLYQHVLSVSETLHNSTIEIANTSHDNDAPADGEGEGGEAATPNTRRKRKETAAAVADFAHIDLDSSPGARREPGAARPPPTLPRMYIELEPRVMGEGEAQLLDLAGEPIGLLTDFHVAWRIQNGLLVEELDGYEERAPLRPIPLMELQAAIEANAPPSPPPLREDTPPPEELPDPDEQDEPHGASTPLPVNPDKYKPLEKPEMPPPPPPVKKERKRKADVKVEDFAGGKIRLIISKELRLALRKTQEFDGASAWVQRVVEQRSRTLLLHRRSLRAKERSFSEDLRGFEYSSLDVSGFMGWSGAEVEAASALARDTRLSSAAAGAAARRPDDSDDDGFFEQSSLGDSDASRVDDLTQANSEKESEAAEWALWRARVAARAARGEQRAPLDVRALAETVISHLPEEGEPKEFQQVLREAAKEDGDVSRLFLATLFLANSGNVDVIPGAPLSLNSFSLRLLSTDARLYSAAAAADPVSNIETAGATPLTPHTPGADDSGVGGTPTCVDGSAAKKKKRAPR